MPVLGYLPKLKKGLELAFDAHFLHGFFMQMLLILYSIDKVSMSYLFSPYLQKFEYLEKEKNFLVEVKNIFHNYLRVIIC